MQDNLIDIDLQLQPLVKQHTEKGVFMHVNRQELANKGRDANL